MYGLENFGKSGQTERSVAESVRMAKSVISTMENRFLGTRNFRREALELLLVLPKQLVIGL